MPDLPPLIAIIGPTATGKSALALKLCEAIGGEIITADSRQVYRYMDIGTDKPSGEERARILHYMIDLVDPDEAFTLADYKEGALKAIGEVLDRGKMPILAGGTPLYVNAVTEGWTIPRVEPDHELRQRLEEEATEFGSPALHERLMKLDPRAAQVILPTNTRRIIRALEVIAATGRPISEQQAKEAPPFSIMRIGLRCERPALYRRIDARVDAQFERGLVEEVAALHGRGYSFNLPSMSGLGYRQVGDYLRGLATFDEAKQRIKWDTHAFVRHQANWLRRATSAHWIDVTEQDPALEAIELARKFVHSVE